MSGVQNIKVEKDDEGVRIDRWFKRHYPHVGFGQLQKIMRKGEVRLDGKRVKGSERVEEGQMIRVPPLGDAPKQEPRAPKLRMSDADIEELQSLVIYQDDDDNSFETIIEFQTFLD